MQHEESRITSRLFPTLCLKLPNDPQIPQPRCCRQSEHTLPNSNELRSCNSGQAWSVLRGLHIELSIVELTLEECTRDIRTSESPVLFACRHLCRDMLRLVSCTRNIYTNMTALLQSMWVNAIHNQPGVCLDRQLVFGSSYRIVLVGEDPSRSKSVVELVVLP